MFVEWMNVFLRMFPFSWLFRNLSLMRILTTRAAHKGSEPLWEDWALSLEVFKDLGVGASLWMEDPVFWMCANPESLCSLNTCLLCTWGIWNLFLRSFKHLYWNNLYALKWFKQSLTSIPVSHQFSVASNSPVLLGHSEAHGRCWNPPGDQKQGS